MKLFWDYHGPTGLTVFIGLASVVVAIIVGSIWANNTSCQRRWPDRSPQFSIWTGCTIIVEGQRIPEGNYRVL